MTYDPARPAGRLLLTPEDKEAPARARRLSRLGLGEHPDPALDAYADHLAELTGAPYAMVNFIDENRQFFAGLHLSNVARPVVKPDGTTPVLGRVGPRPRLLPACGRAAQGPGPGGRLRLPAVRGQSGRRRVRHPLLSGRAADRQHGDGARHRVRRRHRAAALGKPGLETIKASAADLVARLERREADGLPLL